MRPCYQGGEGEAREPPQAAPEGPEAGDPARARTKSRPKKKQRLWGGLRAFFSLASPCPLAFPEGAAAANQKRPAPPLGGVVP
jgi:hypothetical protein